MTGPYDSGRNFYRIPQKKRLASHSAHADTKKKNTLGTNGFLAKVTVKLKKRGRRGDPEALESGDIWIISSSLQLIDW